MIKTWSKCVPFLFIARRNICQFYLYKRKNDLIVNCVKKVYSTKYFEFKRWPNVDLITWLRLFLQPAISRYMREMRGTFYNACTLKHLFSEYFWYCIYVCDFRIILRGCSNPTADKRLCISQVFVTSGIWKLVARSFAIRPLITHISV